MKIYIFALLYHIYFIGKYYVHVLIESFYWNVNTNVKWQAIWFACQVNHLKPQIWAINITCVRALLSGSGAGVSFLSLCYLRLTQFIMCSVCTNTIFKSSALLGDWLELQNGVFLMSLLYVLTLWIWHKIHD